MTFGKSKTVGLLFMSPSGSDVAFVHCNCTLIVGDCVADGAVRPVHRGRRFSLLRDGQLQVLPLVDATLPSQGKYYLSQALPLVNVAPHKFCSWRI